MAPFYSRRMCCICNAEKRSKQFIIIALDFIYLIINNANRAFFLLWTRLFLFCLLIDPAMFGVVKFVKATFVLQQRFVSTVECLLALCEFSRSRPYYRMKVTNKSSLSSSSRPVIRPHLSLQCADMPKVLFSATLRA